MNCKKCKTVLPETAKYCFMCGMSTTPKNTHKRRANGQGTIIKLSKNNYQAIVVIGYKDPAHPVRRKKSGFPTRTAAAEYIPILKQQTIQRDPDANLKEIYDLWEPTHIRGKGTLNCYRAARNYFEPLWYVTFRDIGIDDLQECVNECPMGKRTKENMKALAGLLYQYAIPRHYTNNHLNLAKHIKIYDTGKSKPRESFTHEEFEKIKKACSKIDYADYIYCSCYLGYRPNEFVDLQIENYIKKESCLVGGGKTEAGTDRPVTISPKIIKIVNDLIADRTSGYIFYNKSTKKKLSYTLFKDYFYCALDAIGIENPIIDGVHKYTPSTCRHMFSTLMKRVEGADKDKLALMGHTSNEMLRYYQDVKYDDLRKITNNI